MKFAFVTPALSFRYLKEFGFTIPDRTIVVDDIRVRGCGKSGIKSVFKSKTGHGEAKPVTVHEHKHTSMNETYLSFNIPFIRLWCIRRLFVFHM